MTAFYQRPEPFTVPDGGLATFLTATEGSWADDIEDTIPDVGIGSAKQAADHLAKFGRYEDEYMVHAAEGETVIPKEILDSNPRLKASLFRQMRSMGVDPERYVVGNELNSINPVTGQPEFFLKKLGKFIKKGVKSVIGVLKKAAPIVLSAAINFVAPGLGTAVTGALGAGLGSLVQGKSLKESFNAALLGGAAGALTSGVGSMVKGGTFGEGLSQSLNIKNPFQGQNVLQKALGPKSEAVASETSSGAVTQGTEPLNRPFGKQMGFPTPKQLDPSTVNFNIPQDAALNIAPESKGIINTAKNFFSERLSPYRQSYIDSITKINPATDLPYGENIFKQYAPMLAAGTGVMALTGGFDQKNPKVEGGIDTSRYPPVRVGMPMSPGQLPNYFYPGYDPIIPTQRAAQGGEMFPRRTGQISGPGTGTSDDIPAMLSDGEFVMTANAVKGAGNGSREQGVRRMYDMMRKFEGGAV